MELLQDIFKSVPIRNRDILRVESIMYDVSKVLTENPNFGGKYDSIKRLINHHFCRYSIYLSTRILTEENEIIQRLLSMQLNQYGDLTKKGKEIYLKVYLGRKNKNVRDTIYKKIKYEIE
jgi:hypothetical protein